MKYILLKIIVSIIFIIFSYLIFSNNNYIVINNKQITKIEDKYYGYLEIPVIKMKYGFYDYDSPLNDISKNIEIIKTGINNTYLIAAHSGTGALAYFNDLRKLKIDDEVILTINNLKNTYKIVNIRKIPKNGKINISNKEDMLYLTTCDQILKGYQLIIECLLN